MAKLKVMCARSMHVAVGALGKAFADGAGTTPCARAFDARATAHSVADRRLRMRVRLIIFLELFGFGCRTLDPARGEPSDPSLKI